MKKFMQFIGKCMLGACAAVGMACIGMMQEWNTSTIVGMFLFTGTIVALCLGAFDIEEPTKHQSIKHASRSMRQAA